MREHTVKAWVCMAFSRSWYFPFWTKPLCKNLYTATTSATLQCAGSCCWIWPITCSSIMQLGPSIAITARPRVHSCSTVITPLSNLSWLSDTKRTISVLQGSKKRRVQANRADTRPASVSRLDSCSSWKHSALIVSFCSTAGSFRQFPACSRSATRCRAATAMMSDMIPTERSNVKTCREEEQLLRRCWKASSSATVGPWTWVKRKCCPESLRRPTEILANGSLARVAVVPRFLLTQSTWRCLQPCLPMHLPAAVHWQPIHDAWARLRILRSLTGPTGRQRGIPNLLISRDPLSSFWAMTPRLFKPSWNNKR